MSKTLWHTIKLEVPKEMVNITKNDKVVVKKSLTKTNNISKANKEPSIKIIPGDTNKPKIISDGKEWNIEELKLKMKKQKKKARKTRRRAKNKLKREETALPTRIHSPYIIQPSFNNNILPYINLVNNIAQSQMIYNHQLNVSILNAINSNSNSNQQRTFPNELPPMLTVPTDLSHPYGKT